MKKAIFLLLGIILLTSGCVYSNNTTDIDTSVSVPVPNNTNMAPDFSGIDPTVPFGTGERIQNVTYNATNYSLDLHVFAHAMTVSDTASVRVYIDGVLVSPRSGRPLGAAETAYRGVDITIPKNSSYLVNITNYHHYEWREYPILSGRNGTLSINQTIISGSNYNASYVPYTGATTDLVMGSKNISAYNITASNNITALNINVTSNITAVNITADRINLFVTQSVVTASRAFGTVYMNQGNKTIFISVSGYSAGNAISMTASSDSALNPTTVVNLVHSPSPGLVGALSFMVIPGNRYKVTTTGAGPVLNSWVEWS